MYYGLLKKIENAGGKVGVPASTPTTTPKKGGGKKRNAAPVDDNDDEEATPVIKKKGRKDKKGVEAAADCELSFDPPRLSFRLTCSQLLLRTMPLSRVSLSTRARGILLLSSSHLGDGQHLLVERAPCACGESSIERTGSPSALNTRMDRERRVVAV